MTTDFSILNLFPHSLHQLAMKQFRMFVTLVRSKFHCLIKFSPSGTYRREILILSYGILFACFKMPRMNSIYMADISVIFNVVFSSSIFFRNGPVTNLWTTFLINSLLINSLLTNWLITKNLWITTTTYFIL